jgi:uncharacterized SAM-binding protein YcdF (DUF218 family)
LVQDAAMTREQTDRERTGPSPAAGKGRLRLWRGLLWTTLMLTTGLFTGGFIVFANGIPRAEVKLDRSADGIVVLTGGASRIVDATELLAAGRGKRLLISGVHPATTPAELTRANPEFERLLSCCIDLGHEALNTIGNAIETGRWVRGRGFRSLIVVTSSWHMPRALIEIERHLPGVALIAYPVVSERMREEPWWSSVPTIRLFLVEYVKYLASYARVRLDPAETGADLRIGEHRRSS